VEPASTTLLNPKINHRSDAIFGDQVNLSTINAFLFHR
jgi:hypothetical protein